jgi:hypothetical protein
MAIAIRPDFWNRGLESFAYRDSLTSKCSFILWHFLFPLSNLLLAVRTIPELPAFQAQQRFVPQPVALPDFPGAAQPLNPAAAPRNPHFEELRRLRNNHLGHHNV